ncbi:hypothetical protein B0A50_03279 [Salinomyces thailandicus]|uniref:Xylanolytic transcriptional activator regulatory domain-containing protein n=1 Tax=Salinomyces thailandicus TaxID=706561 RepID=A0A4U0U1X9_9PEZI|nr:hypothetical protein B0A50_03279 [Salinomyces thailandica]
MTESQYHLSQYHSFVAVASLHDENEWPRDLGPIEIEERRRLFWSAYTLDVFTSVIGKGVVRGSEAAFNVCYPTEADDEDIGGAGMNPSRSHSAPHDTTWMRGWNFVTDLYRILEHTLYGFRRLRSKDHRTPLIPVTFFDCPVSQNAVLDHVMTMYQELPASLKATKPVTNCWAENLLSFQAANIAATVQLVRMVLFTTEGSNVEQKCRIASDLVRTFASVPTAYLRAISSPLLHHLTGIGMVLGSAFHDGLTQSSYGNIRTVLLELAELISHLETGLQYSAGTSDKLRTQVESIDEFWRMQEQTKASFGLDTTVDAEGTGIRPTGPGQDDQAHSGQLNEDSPHFHFPTELLENWTWVFDCT